MLSVNEINLLQAQNEGLKKQNAELQKENAELKAENERLKERVKEIGEKMSFLNADRCSEIMRYKQTLQEIDEIISRTDSQHPPSVANMVSIIRHKLYELTKAEEE